MNSIIKLLDITKKAELTLTDNLDDTDEIKLLLMGISNEISQLKNEVYKPQKEIIILDQIKEVKEDELSLAQKIQLHDYLMSMTSTMRVYEIAKALNISSDKVIAYLKSQGANIENHMSKLTPSERNRILGIKK